MVRLARSEWLARRWLYNCFHLELCVELLIINLFDGKFS